MVLLSCGCSCLHSLGRHRATPLRSPLGVPTLFVGLPCKCGSLCSCDVVSKQHTEIALAGDVLSPQAPGQSGEPHRQPILVALLTLFWVLSTLPGWCCCCCYCSLMWTRLSCQTHSPVLLVLSLDWQAKAVHAPYSLTPGALLPLHSQGLCPHPLRPRCCFHYPKQLHPNAPLQLQECQTSLQPLPAEHHHRLVAIADGVVLRHCEWEEHTQ